MWAEARDWLAPRLELPHVYWSPYRRPGRKSRDGIAIFSRHPFVRQETFALSAGHEQGRVAQLVEVVHEGRPLAVCNGHYHWYPGPHPERDRQVQQVLDRVAELPMPVVVAGDFNGTPDTEAVAAMRRHFASAYAVHNGAEPEFTCPTPLSFDWDKPWRGTLDYVFVDRRIRVVDCRLVLTRPLQQNPRIYPSDHFGILARLELPAPPEDR